jgi:hypothetical protein
MPTFASGSSTEAGSPRYRGPPERLGSHAMLNSTRSMTRKAISGHPDGVVAMLRLGSRGPVSPFIAALVRQFFRAVRDLGVSREIIDSILVRNGSAFLVANFFNKRWMLVMIGGHVAT